MRFVDKYASWAYRLIRYVLYVEQKVATGNLGERMAKKPTPPGGQEMATAIGKVIRAHRLAQGFSQEQFAERAGVHRTQAGFLERGERTPSVHTVARAAFALDTLASEILRQAGF